MKNSIIVHDYEYKLGNASSLSKKKRIQFDEENNRVFNIAKLTCCQKFISTKIQFQIKSFYEISVLLPVW